MPYKYKRGQTIFRPEAVTANFDRVAAEVAAIARTVVITEANIAARMAKARAPVRRVFKGGRATIRTMSVSEVNEIRARMMLAEPTMRPERISNREVTHQNRRNTYARSWDLRSAIPMASAKGFDTFRLSNQWVEANRLNKEGRYALKHAKIQEIDEGEYRDRGRGAMHIEIDEHGNASYHLGGNLRASIIMREESYENIVYKVVAGGERAPYAKFMEFGTRYVAARPFLRPAMKHVEQRYPAKMFNALERAFPGRVRRG